MHRSTALSELFGDDESFEFLPAPGIVHFNNTYVFPSSREVHVIDEIGSDDGAWFTRVVRWFEARPSSVGEFGDPIRVFLNTPGGDVESMFAMHDALLTTPLPVEVIAIGQVCSAGVLLLAAGDRRLVTENVVLMSHETTLSGGELGFKASRDRRKFDDWQHLRWAQLMARYTPHDERWWRAKTEKAGEYWLLGGAEIVEAGLADVVVHRWPVGPPTGFEKRRFDA